MLFDFLNHALQLGKCGCFVFWNDENYADPLELMFGNRLVEIDPINSRISIPDELDSSFDSRHKLSGLPRIEW